MKKVIKNLEDQAKDLDEKMKVCNRQIKQLQATHEQHRKFKGEIEAAIEKLESKEKKSK